MVIEQQVQDLTKQHKGALYVRATIYYALAEALTKPVLGIEDHLLETVTAGAEILNSAACRQAMLTLKPRPALDIGALEQSYTRAISNPGGRPVALYESLHRQGCLMGRATHEVAEYYQVLGLVPARGELPDHAAVELALLGHLATAEMEAQKCGHTQLSSRLRSEQRVFLRRYAGTWLPEVGLALAASGEGFYAAVGRLLSGFLTEEMIGRQRKKIRTGMRVPGLDNPANCTLCGLCVGSCSFGALRIVEDEVSTTLSLNISQCTGCNRCAKICPEGILSLDPAAGTQFQMHQGQRMLSGSPRARCPVCGQPTVSQAELDAVFARLEAESTVQWCLSLCVECKSFSM